MGKNCSYSGKHNKFLGKKAEDQACDYLIEQGLSLLECNYSSRVGEIDLIMRDKNSLVFVEVRYRKSHIFGATAETINRQKRQKIIKTAAQYLLKHSLHSNTPCRFDVIAITPFNEQGDDILWIKDAFQVQC